MPSARSRSVVGQRQHQQWCPPSRPTSSPGDVHACTAVNGLVERAGVGEQLGRRAPVLGDAPLVLGRLLGHVGVQQRTRARRPSAATAAIAGRSTARTEWTAAPIRTPSASASSAARAAHASTSPSENRRCVVVELDAGPAAQVARVEQRDAQPGLAGGGDQRVAHRVRVVVRRPVRPWWR